MKLLPIGTETKSIGSATVISGVGVGVGVGGMVGVEVAVAVDVGVGDGVGVGVTGVVHCPSRIETVFE